MNFDSFEKVINELTRTYTKYGRHGHTFVVTAEDYVALMKEAETKCIYQDIAPTPPIKRKKTSFGFFYREEEIEWDWHAPEYLKALGDWEIRQQLKKELICFGPEGKVKIEVCNIKGIY